VSILQDDSQWPIVIDTVVGELSDEDIRCYNVRRAERLSRAERHAQIIDGRARVRMSARHRKMIADFDAKNRDARQRHLAAVALVTESIGLRGVLAVIYRVTPSVCPRKPFGTPEQAQSWARGCLNDKATSGR
jgi:hypothetical protein